MTSVRKPLVVDIWLAFVEFFREVPYEEPELLEGNEPCGRYAVCALPPVIEIIPYVVATVPKSDIMLAIAQAMLMADAPGYSDEMRLAVQCMAIHLEQTLSLPVIHGA